MLFESYSKIKMKLLIVKGNSLFNRMDDHGKKTVVSLTCTALVLISVPTDPAVYLPLGTVVELVSQKCIYDSGILSSRLATCNKIK